MVLIAVATVRRRRSTRAASVRPYIPHGCESSQKNEDRDSDTESDGEIFLCI